MNDTPHTTFAQNLWRKVRRGDDTPTFAIQTFIAAVDENALERQLDSMPEEMLAELKRFLSDLPTGAPDWEDSLLIFGTQQIPYMREASAGNHRRVGLILAYLQRRDAGNHAGRS